MRKTLGILVLSFLFCGAANATPGNMTKLNEHLLSSAPICVLNRPFSADEPFTVYCDGIIAIEFEGFEGGFMTSRKAREGTAIVSKALSAMISRGYSVLLPAGSSADLANSASLTFVKQPQH